jgi:hypothetical protein
MLSVYVSSAGLCRLLRLDSQFWLPSSAPLAASASGGGRGDSGSTPSHGNSFYGAPSPMPAAGGGVGFSGVGHTRRDSAPTRFRSSASGAGDQTPSTPHSKVDGTAPMRHLRVLSCDCVANWFASDSVCEVVARGHRLVPDDHILRRVFIAVFRFASPSPSSFTAGAVNDYLWSIRAAPQRRCCRRELGRRFSTTTSHCDGLHDAADHTANAVVVWRATHRKCNRRYAIAVQSWHRFERQLHLHHQFRQSRQR